MPAVNKEQIAAANLNYRMYPLEFFLDTQKELGLRSIEFCAVAPHFLMDYEGYRDTAPIRAMAEEPSDRGFYAGISPVSVPGRGIQR